MKISSVILCLLLAVSCAEPKQEPKQEPIPQYTIGQFYRSSRVTGGYFSPNEDKLLVSSNETGIFNVYEIDIKTGDKKQITSSDKESFFAAGYVPETGEILYSADKGGNENYHIYLLSENGETTDLTPGEKEKAHIKEWNNGNSAIYFTSNRRDQRYFDLYKMPVKQWQTEILYQNDEGMQIAGLSHDEKTVALLLPVTRSTSQLFLRDRLTGTTTEASDPEKPGYYEVSGFSNDGSKFYYTTNAGNEFIYLVEYDVSTGNRKILYETKWDVKHSSLSKNEKYRVVIVNEDANNKVILFDNSTGEEIRFPNIPDGQILDITISDSEENARLTVGSSKVPSDIYVYNFKSGNLNKLTETLNPEINPNHLVAGKVIRYSSFDSLEIPAVFYRPRQASESKKVPALIWVHGGPGEQSRAVFSELIQYLVNHGYAVLAVNNRGSSGYGKTFYNLDNRDHSGGDLKDCIWGKKWLQEQNYIDPEKIGIIGRSYGGYLTMAAMAFESDEFKAGVNIFGVTNWLRTLKSIPAHWEADRDALYDELGDPYTEDSVRLHKISPLFHANQVKNPVMVLQGANDPRVLQVESDEIVEALKKNKVPVEYIVFPDEGHGFLKKENEIRGYGQILEFLDTHLK